MQAASQIAPTQVCLRSSVFHVRFIALHVQSELSWPIRIDLSRALLQSAPVSGGRLRAVAPPRACLARHLPLRHRPQRRR